MMNTMQHKMSLIEDPTLCDVLHPSEFTMEQKSMQDVFHEQKELSAEKYECCFSNELTSIKFWNLFENEV